MSFVENLVAGVAAGVGICAVGHPFDTIKVLMQMQPGKFSGFLAAARETMSQHGPLGLYRGVAAPLVGSGFYNAVQFATYSRIKNAFTNGGRDNTLNRIGAAAAVTGVFVAFVEGVREPLCAGKNRWCVGHH
jgi:solute carrier family 25 (mitochondrial carnitine/acylcarnitine transporter), member 20/29